MLELSNTTNFDRGLAREVVGDPESGQFDDGSRQRTRIWRRHNGYLLREVPGSVARTVSSMPTLKPVKKAPFTHHTSHTSGNVPL
jgi:hypothetical protein